MQSWEYRMGDIGMIKVGACLVSQTRRRVVGDIVDHSGISSGLEVYQRRRGGINSKYTQTYAQQGNKRCYRCSNAVLGDTGEGGKHPGKFSRSLAFSDK